MNGQGALTWTWPGVSNRRVVVTGGTGFIGCHLAGELVRHGYEPVLLDVAPDLDNLRLIAGDYVADTAKILTCDVTNPFDVLGAVGTILPEVIIHLASPLPPDTERDATETFRRMVGGHTNVLEAARLWKTRKVVWASATSVFGPPEAHGGPQTPIRNSAPHYPSTLYGIAKSTCERLSGVHRTRHNVDSVGLRLAQGYGPGKKRGRPFGYELFERAVSGVAYEVPFGDDLVNWQYVGDIASILAKAGETGLLEPIALNTTGVVLTMRESVAILSQICPQASLSVLPGTTGLVWRYDVSELQRAIGDMKVTGVREGFAKTVSEMTAWQTRIAGSSNRDVGLTGGEQP